MKAAFLMILFVFPVIVHGQLFGSLDTVKAPQKYENIWVKQVASDSLSSSFVIFVKSEVKKHRHAHHTESVYVLDGTGEMSLGDKTFSIKKGDYIFIPENTPHAVKVTSSEPLKILSVQSPYFDGKDRIFTD